MLHHLPTAHCRGFYPRTPFKENQDQYLVVLSVNGNNEIHLFGVFDGHGEGGHDCSRLAAQAVRVGIAGQFARTVGFMTKQRPADRFHYRGLVWMDTIVKLDTLASLEPIAV